MFEAAFISFSTHGISHSSGWNPEPLFQILSSTPDAVKVKL